MEETRNIIQEGWTRGIRHISSSTSLISFKLGRIRAALMNWIRQKASPRVPIDNNKLAVDHLNAVEERRPFSILEFTFSEFASAKAEKLILWQTAMWRRRANIRWCVAGDETASFYMLLPTIRPEKTR
ncbi:hypothetical protein ACQJBY_044320 [Aegilops geniculata]